MELRRRHRRARIFRGGRGDPPQHRTGTPLEGIYQGHAEVRKLWADIRETFAEARFDIDRATEHDGVVLVLALSGCAAPAAVPWRTRPSGLSPSSSTDLEGASSSGPATSPKPSKPSGCRSRRCRRRTWRRCARGRPGRRARNTLPLRLRHRGRRAMSDLGPRSNSLPRSRGPIFLRSDARGVAPVDCRHGSSDVDRLPAAFVAGVRRSVSQEVADSSQRYSRRQRCASTTMPSCRARRLSGRAGCGPLVNEAAAPLSASRDPITGNSVVARRIGLPRRVWCE